MSDNLLNLYPQKPVQGSDRRQQSVPVNFERRSGTERRTETRLNLQPELKGDVLEVKSKIDELYIAFKGYDVAPQTNFDYYKSFVQPKKKDKKPPKNELVEFALSSVPFARRIVNIEKNKEENNTVKTVGLTAIALTNVAEDVRDLLTLVGKTKSKADPGFYSKYGFFVGTSIEDNLKKVKWGKSILKLDQTVGDLFFKNKIFDKLNIDFTKKKFVKEVTHLNGNVESVIRRYVKFGGNKFVKTLGLALYRMPLISIAIASLLELPSITKAKDENKGKQAVNSALNVGLGVTTGAILSAVLAPINPVLPILGLGAGYYIGGKIAKAIGYKLSEN